MGPNDILLLNAEEILSLVTNQEIELINVVRESYSLHSKGKSSLPVSSFLHFPSEPQNRIIALPAYLKMDKELAGIKWVSSFPENINVGLDRASAVLLINSAQTGRTQVIMEGAIISAKRTAASAALAAQVLRRNNDNSVGVIGCGLINFEIIRFLLKIIPDLETLLLFDSNYSRANQFRLKCQKEFGSINVIIEKSIETIFVKTHLISLATTASTPHIFDISKCKTETLILHISLRDLSATTILSCTNIVDDIEHVCRAETSIHLAENVVKNRNFIAGTIADVISRQINLKDKGIIVFSPFGLGILDIAVGNWVFEKAILNNKGTIIKSFLSNLSTSSTK